MPTPSLAELRSHPETASWFQTLEAPGQSTAPLPWPDEDTFVERLRFFGIPEDDIAILQTYFPLVSDNPDLRWIVERYAQVLHARLGQPGYSPLPDLPAGFGELGHHLFTFVYVIHFPATLAYHQSRGIPLAVTQDAMADIGHHYLVERHDHQRSGLAGGARWLPLHARGLIYQFARLQFEITCLDEPIREAIGLAGLRCVAGEPVLSIHIPGLMGPMPPDACDASFARAIPFFARHFPELGLRYATCESWLLDPQLADSLPATSNIVQFQRRFHLVPDPEPDNDEILRLRVPVSRDLARRAAAAYDARAGGGASYPERQHVGCRAGLDGAGIASAVTCRGHPLSDQVAWAVPRRLQKAVQGRQIVIRSAGLADQMRDAGSPVLVQLIELRARDLRLMPISWGSRPSARRCHLPS